MTSENNNDQVFWECGTGWKRLIDPLIERADREGAKVQQIKEKFGRLRVYLDFASDELYDLIDQAEVDSAKVCELCGQPGVMMTKGGWLKTVCAEHALDLGYKTRA